MPPRKWINDDFMTIGRPYSLEGLPLSSIRRCLLELYPTIQDFSLHCLDIVRPNWTGIVQHLTRIQIEEIAVIWAIQ